MCTGLLACFTVFAFAQKSTQLVNTMEKAIQERNPATIKPYLSEDFRVGIYGSSQAYGMLGQVLSSYDTLEKLVYLKEDNKNISLKYYYKKKSFESTIQLDSSGKIARIPFFDQLFGVNLSNPSRLAAVVPFEFDKGKIVVKLTLNDSKRVLRFLFDTGADGMGIKKEVADEIGIQASRQQQTSVVGASTQVGIATGLTMHFDTLAIRQQNSAIFPRFDGDLDGLFGGNFLRNYITEIDFDKSEIRLYTLGKFTYPTGGALVPLDFSAGVPGIQGTVKLNSGKTLNGNFHFDTGAGYPLILFGPSVHRNKLEEGFHTLYQSTNYSMGHTSNVSNGIFESLQIGSKQLNHFIGTLQSYREGDERWSPSGDGSFGITLIQKFNCIINLADRQFYLTPNKNYAVPSDFWLHNTLWGFSNGELRVKQIMPETSAASSGIAVNDLILSINGVKSADLLDVENIRKYTLDWKNAPIQIEIKKPNLNKPWKTEIE
ncbi:hypothetical protein DF182_12245 [Chitinophaga flava]|uniref:PDZ domain-containing protein n=2 Tax=Chitinophaga flava TaxID=2259036 RepID=A0A365Y4P2_9BACT|nr:hypothetical protein DF182_12245 [Chitinophaga flava]